MQQFIHPDFRNSPALQYVGSNCVLILGDALTWLPRIKGVNAIITDPPYCSGSASTASRKQRTGQKYSTDRCNDFADFDGEKRDQRTHQLFTERWMHMALNASAENCHLFCFSDFRQIPLTSDALQLAGWRWDGMAVWDKINGRPKPNGIRQQTEYVLHGTKNIFNKPCSLSVYLPGVIRMSLVPQPDRLHLTQKPADLMQHFINVVQDGGLILDPFCGSGSTAVAALQSGRKIIVIESVTSIFNTALDRLKVYS